LTVLSMLPNAADYDFRILATDIDPKILALARAGAYDATALETVSPAMRKQWFTETSVNGRQKWQVDDRVKKLITFNELNLMAQWPFKGQFDVIFCRNVVIYFDEPTQMKIWSRFGGMLNPKGHLYIGHSERVSGDAKSVFDNIGITTYRYTGKPHGGRL
jgi:chemotaxis protein methyltransferase CheR